MRILGRVRDEIVAHARAEAPHECCGLLLERDGVLSDAVRTRNMRASPTRYLVHPEDHFAALRRARSEGARVAAAYHSHPASAARPSETDVAEAHDPDLVYVIVSLKDGEEVVLAWRLVAGAVHPVPLLTV